MALGLAAMPSEILLEIASRLDGSSLARLVECTSHAIHSTFTLHQEQLDARWKELLREMGPVLAAFPDDGAIQTQSSHKQTFVRATCFLHTKCARCGRRSMPSRRIDGTLDTNRYLHLCDWLDIADKGPTAEAGRRRGCPDELR